MDLNPEIRISLVTESNGSDAKSAMKRATAIIAELERQGIDPDRIDFEIIANHPDNPELWVTVKVVDWGQD